MDEGFGRQGWPSGGKRRLFYSPHDKPSHDKPSHDKPSHDKPSPKRLISPKSKDALVALKKVDNAFSHDVQEMFDDFIRHVETAAHEEIDLSEVGLMLGGCTKIYAKQVDTLVQDINVFASNLSRIKTEEKEKKKRERQKTDKTNLKERDDQEDKDKTVVNLDSEGNVTDVKNDQECDASSTIIVDPEKSKLPEETNVILTDPSNVVDVVNPDTVQGDLVVDLDSSLTVPESTTTDSGISVGTCDSLSGPDELSDQIINEIPGPNTRKRLRTLQNILELDENGQPKTKRPRNGFKLPPLLISCFQELEELEKNGKLYSFEDSLIPPILRMEARISRKFGLLYREDYIKDMKKYKEPSIKNKDTILSTNVIADPGSHGINNVDSVSANANTDVPADGVPNASGNCSDTTASNMLEPTLPESDGLTNPISSSSATFSCEDQTAIQECINELHYLPFTFELKKADLAIAFSKTVERMSKIFQKNNVRVTRNIVKEASVIASATLKDAESPRTSQDTMHPRVHDLSDIYTAFVKSCREECESYIPKEETILERTKEKSYAESRANIRAMISELQRNIVPKFARVPLMAENTPEFFLHVTKFEKKMKKVLEEESKKDEFDVRKYERDVLEVTAKESSEIDRLGEEFMSPKSPSIHEEHVESGSALLSPSSRSSFDGSQSSVSNSWVPIKHIFQHMKSINRTEAARSFYAVLALLSYQNLDINYDQLYSEESAALITNQLKEMSKQEEIDEKYTRGVKIVTSRCPDVDKEEVYIAALTSESRDEAFRHLLAQEEVDDRSKQPSSSKSSSSSKPLMKQRFEEGIAEAMADFVEESGSMFSGRLEGRKRKPKPDS